MASLKFQSITFSYPSSPEDILRNITFELFPGWYGLTGANGSGKSTLMKLAAGYLTPQSGSLSSPPAAYCPQETGEKPPGWEEFQSALYDRDNQAGRLFSLLNLDHDWPWRWDTLSQGERKRYQLAVLLWQDRELILVDEPTNHLDQSSRRLILESLKLYKGIGVIVSHDRDFMDELCKGHLFLRNGQTRLRPGTLTSCLEEEEKERQGAIKLRREAADELKRLEKEAAARRRLAESQQKRRSKAGLDIKDHDSRYKKNLARITGKDGTGGKLLRQMDGRLDQTRNRLSSLDGEGSRKTGVTQRTARYGGDRILYLPPGEIPLDEERILRHGELLIRPGDRIALTGDNGMGKTTLIRAFLRGDWNRQRILYLPQELDKEERLALRDQWNDLSPEKRGRLLSYFSRLGGDPEAFLATGSLSPGEERKLLIAFGLLEEPVLMILDEPTNHLDLDSVTILESALAQTDTALLLVSHDSRFLKKLTSRVWNLSEKPSEDRIIRLEDIKDKALPQ